MDEPRNILKSKISSGALSLALFAGISLTSGYAAGQSATKNPNASSNTQSSSGKESALIPRSVLFGNPEKAS